MFPSATHGGHSAQVKMRLLVNDLSLSVAQMGPDFLLLGAPAHHPPADASLVLSVDQSERRWNVRLPEGISSRTKRVMIAASV
jgi:hypothetical protein